MSNVFFTSYDGTVWINKTFIKHVIYEILDQVDHGKISQRFADAVLERVNACYYKEQPINLTDPDTDYFYCGSCRRGFPVRYTAEIIRMNERPCPRCGAQSNRTKK